MRRVVGIDPGLSGAIALLEGENVEGWDMPVSDKRISPALLATILRDVKPDLVVIENVASRPGQGVASSFKFGDCAGVCRAVPAVLGYSVRFVTPASWKRHHGLSADKEESRRRALELWPGNAGLFKRKKDEARAEAALIAAFGRKQWGEQ